MILFITSSAGAQETGSISGTIFDRSGQPAANATVRVTGERLPAERSVVTGDSGAYRFEYLLPGNYAIDVDHPDGRIRRAALVELGRDTQVDVVIGVAVTEQLTVTAATPIVDTRSTEVSFNIKDDLLGALPLERTYRGLFQLIPGVPDNRSVIGPAAGGSRQDNTYLIDGANITNPAYGYLSTEINELDVAEVNLKRAGVTAEFGRSGGSITNVVSRSGSNQLSGIARVDWLPEGLVADYKLPDDLRARGVRPGAFRDPLLTTETGPAIGIGGPLKRDHIFFYGSARYSRETKWDRFNKLGASLPDEVSSVQEYYAKITAVPTVRHQLNVSYRHRPRDIDHYSLDSDSAASVATDTDNSSGVASVDWAHFLNARTSVNVRYLFMKENNENVPVTDLGYLPPFNPAALATMGQYNDPAQADVRVGGNQYTNIQNYRRHELRAVGTRFFEMARSSHALKAGVAYEFGQETLNRIANGWGTIVAITQNGVPALRTRYYTRQQPQLGEGRTYSLFVQDDMIVATRLAINAGVLLNRDDFAQHVSGSGGCPASIALKGGAAVYDSHGDTCTFLRFGFADEVQPRIGVSYQLRQAKSDKAYANWGRYYNMDQKSSGRSLAPVRIFQTQTIFDLSGNVLSSGPFASTTGKLIDPDIRPIYTDEILVGYSTPLSPNLSIDAFAMFRGMHNFIEDLPTRLPDSSPYVAANLPCTRFAACQSANAKRTYRAFTVAVRRRLSEAWSTDVNYTWSRFEGNFDLDYSTVAVFNTSSFIQDGPGTNVEDPNRFGPLLEDRPHVLKIFTTYSPTGRVTTSAYVRVQSGTPWAARGRDWEGAALNYLEPAGTHRNPTWGNLDVMGSYRVPMRGRTTVALEARLLNVFDNQTRLATDAQQFLDLRTQSAPPYFAPYLQPNPFFATGNGFAPPRRLFLAAVARF